MRAARSTKMSLRPRRRILADKEWEEIVSSEQRSWFRSKSGLVLLGLLALAGFFLWEEHEAHLLRKYFRVHRIIERFSEAEAQRAVESLGGNAASSVSRQTDYVVVGSEPGTTLG